ncbi:Dapper 2 [Clarias magur]|uniref:Dapper 2 n=1 Tax=Clarias magur TaxID=1594786 RepID=A0A8J4V2D3_CLAMG|nr:Dapper 2 [Clarias magur]
MIDVHSNFGRVSSSCGALLMKGLAVFDNLFSILYPSPMLIPLAVADSEVQRIENISVCCQAMQSD